MHPFFSQTRFRTGLCSGIILFAVVLRLVLVPGLPGRVRDGLVRIAGRPGVIGAVLFLETGLRVDVAGDGDASDQSPVTSHQGTGDESMAAVVSGHYGTENGAAGGGDSGGRDDPSSVTSVRTGDTFPPGGRLPAGDGDVGTGDESMTAVVSGHYGTEEKGHYGEEEKDGPAGDESRRAGFSAEEAEEILLRGNCTYAVDKAELLLRPLGWTRTEGPSVLIVHTHTSEAYTPTEGWEYSSAGNYRTLEPARSVVAVGDALAEELEKRGVGVIHDRACNDYPDYNRSYASARENILKDLAEYPSIRLVIDLHRDAMEQPVREVTELDGQDVAKLMLVVGTDEGGLSHPHWPENLSCALKLQALANRSAPGLFKSISFRRERFNGDLCPGEMIVEVGSTGNSLPEAIAAMPYLAQALAELLEAD